MRQAVGLNFRSMALALAAYMLLYELRTWVVVYPVPGSAPTIVIPLVGYVLLIAALAMPQEHMWVRIFLYIVATVVVATQIFLGLSSLVWELFNTIRSRASFAAQTLAKVALDGATDLLVAGVVLAAALEAGVKARTKGSV